MILVIGSGVAGLTSALAAARMGEQVTLVTPGRLDRGLAKGDRSGVARGDVELARVLAGGSTALAQGGIAAAMGEGDSPEQHLSDTIAAGGGHVDEEAASVLVHDGVAAVRHLIDAGFAADRDESGALAFGLEGAHGMARIVHAGGDRTGAMLHAFLVSQLGSVCARARAGRSAVEVLEGHGAQRLIVDDDGVVRGAVLRDPTGAQLEARADAVILATGGFAGLYSRSTNPVSSRGEGILIAAEAGAVIADLEFVQFHPTVLRGAGELISEAVRGAGAVLRDGSGRRFMRDRDPRAELAPRDVVSREIERVLALTGEQEVWLDALPIERAGGVGTLARRFPGLTRMLQRHGYDWRREMIPVVPAAHYTMGGVASDLRGRSSVPGLFVAGEVAATGVHGANRLASNSLLEGLVFGERAAAAAKEFAVAAAWELEGAGMRSLVSGQADPARLRTDRSPLGRAIARAQAQSRDRRLQGSIAGC